VPRREGGLVVTVRGERRFIPASIAVSVLSRPVVSRVPGTGLGMTLHHGRVLTVIELGSEIADVVVCDLGDESVALAGLEVSRAGFFDLEREGARVDGAHVAVLDVAAEARALEARLAAGARAAGSGG
jgi:hypothetical protein